MKTHPRLTARAIQRLRTLEPTQAQLRPPDKSDDMPLIISRPDRRRYGPGICIHHGRLVDDDPNELIQAYGQKFFEQEIEPHLKA